MAVLLPYNFLSEAVSSKLEIQCKKSMHFSFNFAWHSIQLDTVRTDLQNGRIWKWNQNIC